jgi:hypothetical protein
MFAHTTKTFLAVLALAIAGAGCTKSPPRAEQSPHPTTHDTAWAEPSVLGSLRRNLGFESMSGEGGHAASEPAAARRETGAEGAGGAECVTANGAPYEAQQC